MDEEKGLHYCLTCDIEHTIYPEEACPCCWLTIEEVIDNEWT